MLGLSCDWILGCGRLASPRAAAGRTQKIQIKIHMTNQGQITSGIIEGIKKYIIQGDDSTYQHSHWKLH